MNQSLEKLPDTSFSNPQRMLPPTVFWRIAEEIPKPLTWSFMALSIGIPFCAWLIVFNAGLVQPLFLPTPAQVWIACQSLWESGDLQKDIAYSLFRVLTGFLLAAIISIPLGTLMGTFASIRSLMEPIVGIVRYMPAPAFIPLLILYFGLGELLKCLV